MYDGAMTRTIAPILLVSLAIATATGMGAQVTTADPEYTGDDRLERWSGKRILVLSPHPDDDVLTSGGTLALLARGGNEVHVVVYTSGNAGSRDPEMTRQRLAEIRTGEERRAMAELGVPEKNLVFFGYDDGMLEYVDARELTRRVASEIRRVRPDAILSPDPGAPYQQYHKSDHRAGAFITADAIRAARFRLYFPDLEASGLDAWDVPLCFFYYSAQPNYTVDVTAMGKLKARAAASHTSQFGTMVDRYRSDAVEAARSVLTQEMEVRFRGDDGRFVERFRRATGY